MKERWCTEIREIMDLFVSVLYAQLQLYSDVLCCNIYASILLCLGMTVWVHLNWYNEFMLLQRYWRSTLYCWHGRVCAYCILHYVLLYYMCFWESSFLCAGLHMHCQCVHASIIFWVGDCNDLNPTFVCIWYDQWKCLSTYRVNLQGHLRWFNSILDLCCCEHDDASSTQVVLASHNWIKVPAGRASCAFVTCVRQPSNCKNKHHTQLQVSHNRFTHPVIKPSGEFISWLQQHIVGEDTCQSAHTKSDSTVKCKHNEKDVMWHNVMSRLIWSKSSWNNVLRRVLVARLCGRPSQSCRWTLYFSCCLT